MDSTLEVIETALPPNRGKVDLRAWVSSVTCWDGVLPICVVAAPQLARYFEASRETAEYIAAFAPIIAFFFRVEVGRRWIASNHCGTILRVFQFLVFLPAAIYLVCLEALLLLALEMNQGALWRNDAERNVVIALWAVYFLAMLFALFPGRTKARSEREGAGDLSEEATEFGSG